jgi:hypothetical protein
LIEHSAFALRRTDDPGHADKVQLEPVLSLFGKALSRKKSCNFFRLCSRARAAKTDVGFMKILAFA